MTQEEEIAQLKKERSQVLERVSELVEQLSKAKARESEYQKPLSAMQAENQALNEQLVTANIRIEELEKLKTPPPAFAKANKKKSPEEQKKARTKRDAQQNRGRPRSSPTQIVEHRLVSCPHGHRRLGGMRLARTREVIDVPPPPPVEVTPHRIYKGWCAGC
jgi:transposase